jgi:hypothetical protein
MTAEDKERMEKAEFFIKTFSDEFLSLIRWYDKLLLEMGEKQNEMLAFIGIIVHTFGEDNKFYLSSEEIKKWKDVVYRIEANVDDDGGITYTTVIEEASENAESDSGENIQT